MHFVSTDYMALLGITLLLYWALPGRRARLFVLVVASYAFYMAWSSKLVVLLWFSTGLDFVCGSRIALSDDPHRRRRWLTLSLAGNLGLLGLFKYYGFFIDSAIVLLRELGLHPHERTLYFILPLGISFYTFQTLSYTIDIYRRHMEPTRDLLEFAVFVGFFPQLVAGPIVRARDFLPQVAERREFDIREFQWGLERILIGVLKKAVIADNLAQVVDATFANAAHTTSTHAWMAAFGFYVQLYCDFSAYSDIAIGSSRLFGFRIRENFTRPYLTTNPQAYWQNWHISLNTWLRDYVYFPLGGSRLGPRRTYVNLFLTMFISGLWHGAAWRYLLWGSYHAICLCVHRAWAGAGYRLPYVIGVLGQVAFNTVGFLMFRADSWQNMVDICTAAAAWPSTALAPAEWGIFGWAALIFGLEPLGPRIRRLCQRPVVGPILRGLLVGLGFAVVMLAKPLTTPDFVYFVF